VSSWYLVDCLVALRGEFNRLSPNRDTGSDGSIGDTAHAARSSDHNPRPDGRVLALDIDATGPWPAWWNLDDAVQDIVREHRAGRDDRLEYVIWQRQIASESSSWVWEPYGGSDPHTGHAHFSARHDRHGEHDTTYWGVCMNPTDVTRIAKETTDLTILALTNTLKNTKSDLAAVARATPMQYGIGVDKAGLPVDGTTLLGTITALYHMVEDIKDVVSTQGATG
jgi:hypothetical protein